MQLDKLLCLVKHRFETFELDSARVRICARCGRAERAVYYTDTRGVTVEHWIRRVTITWEEIH